MQVPAYRERTQRFQTHAYRSRASVALPVTSPRPTMMSTALTTISFLFCGHCHYAPFS